MKETKIQISPTCHFELVEYETFPTTLTLDYTEHSPAHGYSDTETTVDIEKGQASQIISLLQKFVGGEHDKIFIQIYKAVEKLSPTSVELLCILGSIGDTLSDSEVLECLEQYNEHGTCKSKVLFDVNDTPQDRRNRLKLI